MTINEVLKRLKELSKDTKLRAFDNFGIMFTFYFTPFSYRGAFDQPAIELEIINDRSECTTAVKAIKDLQEFIEEDSKYPYEGYKGGEYYINSDSPLYLVSSMDVAGKCMRIQNITSDGYVHTYSKCPE